MLPNVVQPSAQDVRRRLGALLPAAALAGVDDGPGLERVAGLPVDPPRVRAAVPIEGHAVRARPVLSAARAEDGFAAFLDGTQRSRVIGYVDGLPIVHGTVAAVIRVRRNRRLTTWGRGPVVERRVYAPLARFAVVARVALDVLARELTLELVDTADAHRGEDMVSAHPFAVSDRALGMVKEDRERVEKGLAERWCRQEQEPLFVDGGIQESDVVARAACVAGVVKSHRTLYVDADALRTVLALRQGERSTAFLVGSARRTAVASWYLRLRDPAGRDPMWGLVRVEAAAPDPAEAPDAFTERIDRLSRWVLAEAAPLSLPDARWDKLAYGVHDCEQFLRAIA